MKKVMFSVGSFVGGIVATILTQVIVNYAVPKVQYHLYKTGIMKDDVPVIKGFYYNDSH